MNPDRAAELLQIPERGIELLQRFEKDEATQKAIQAVQSGFSAPDVASMFGLPYDASVLQDEGLPDGEGSIFIYECQTKRCRQKNRVATSSVAPDDVESDKPTCPSCGRVMSYVMSVAHEMDIPAELKRTFLPRTRIHDSMHGVDKAGASGRDMMGDDDD